MNTPRLSWRLHSKDEGGISFAGTVNNQLSLTQTPQIRYLADTSSTFSIAVRFVFWFLNERGPQSPFRGKDAQNMGGDGSDSLVISKDGRVETRVLILCAGDGERWGEYLGRPKQLAPVGGRPLLVRTVEQVEHQFGVLPVIVTRDPRLHLSGCQSFYPERRRWVVETFISTHCLWRQRTVVLLGDVMYTNHAMATIHQGAVGLVIFGRRGASMFSGKRYGEIFGLSFHWEDWDFVLDCLNHAIAETEKGGRGKLWDFYYFARAHQPAGLQSVTFCEIHDYTEDFDFPREYRYLERLYDWGTCSSPVLRGLALTWSLILCTPYAGWHRWKQWCHDRRECRQRKYRAASFAKDIHPHRRAA